MDDPPIEHQKKLLRDFLLLIGGAVVVLFLTSFEDAHFLYTDVRFSATPGLYMPITGWFGIWFLLQITSLGFSFLVLMGKNWRKEPFWDRADLFFGFLAVSWSALFSFDIRMANVLATGWQFLTFGLGLLLLVAFLLVRKYKKIDIFP
jgi:hypothetical protein